MIKIALCSLVLLVVSCSSAAPRTPQLTQELDWLTVPLKGMHLQLESPKSSNRSEDLHFGDGSLAVEVCTDGICSHPLTVWRIEGNRLKTGFEPGEGDVLLEYTGRDLVLRDPDGTIRTYEVVRH